MLWGIFGTLCRPYFPSILLGPSQLYDARGELLAYHAALQYFLFTVLKGIFKINIRIIGYLCLQKGTLKKARWYPTTIEKNIVNDFLWKLLYIQQVRLYCIVFNALLLF